MRMEQYTCANPACGKAVWKYTCQLAGRVYCSRACHYAGMASRPGSRQRTKHLVSKPCATCGEEFSDFPGVIAKRKYCSMPCYRVSRRGTPDDADRRNGDRRQQ